jgi:curved DNA-binding protein CbpA
VTEERDPYQILGVSPDASDDEIRRAYHAHARRLHPDVVGESGLDDMRNLNQAWTLLKDPEKRAAHDAAHGRTTRRSAGGDGDGAAKPGGTASTGPARQTFAGQPAWTGAAGPPPGRPWGTVLSTGIYAGWSLGEVVRRDRGYLVWLRDRPEAKALRQEIDKLLEMSKPGGSETDKDKGGRKRR